MSVSVPIKKTPYGTEGDAPVHRIRITLTSRKVKELEKGEPHATTTLTTPLSLPLHSLSPR